MGDVLFASGDGHLSALNARDGQALWAVDLSDKKKVDNAGGPPLLARGYLVVPTSTGLVFVDPSSGHPRLGVEPGQGRDGDAARSTAGGSTCCRTWASVFALQLYGAQH